MALSGGYSACNRLTTQEIGKIFKKFEETESVADIERPVYHRFVRVTPNIAIVSESVAEGSNVYISRHSQELGISYGRLWRILNLDLHRHPYKVKFL